MSIKSKKIPTQEDSNFDLNVRPNINDIFPIELNPYQLLGLNKNATSLEIELAFRENLSKKPQFR